MPARETNRDYERINARGIRAVIVARMQAVFLLLACIAVAQAGSVTGVAVEHSSSRPLARTVVRLEPVRGGSGNAGAQPLTVRTSQSGQFLFPAVPAGTYFLNSMRTGFYPASYGQRLPAGRGLPVTVTSESNLFAELRMRRRGAITGRVLDENGVGAAGVPVVAYRARLPLRVASSATSDDRGVFRVAGLEPGKYWVRSGAHTLEDGGSWIPTFSPQDSEPRNAKVYNVAVDSDTTDADLHPRPGQLFMLSGLVVCEAPSGVHVTLSSEVEQRTAQAKCGAEPAGFQFKGMAAGLYELFAVTTDGVLGAAHMELTLGGNLIVNLPLTRPVEVDVEITDANGAVLPNAPVTLVAKRQSLSQSGEGKQLAAGRARLEPGYWEVSATAPAGQYVQSIYNSRGGRARRRAVAASDSFEVYIAGGGRNTIQVAVAGPAGKIAGRVVSEGKAVPGAPVHVWPVGDSERRSVGGPLTITADVFGAYELDSLPPGEYRLMASFDVSEVDAEVMERASASTVRIKDGAPASADLTLWVAPY